MLSVPENKSNLCGGLAIQQKRAATHVAIETSVAEDYVSCLRHVDARQTLLLRPDASSCDSSEVAYSFSKTTFTLSSDG